MWPHDVEPWFHFWYRGRVETLDANSYLGISFEGEPWFHSWYRSRVETLDANSYLGISLLRPHEVEPLFHSWYRDHLLAIPTVFFPAPILNLIPITILAVQAEYGTVKTSW